MTTAQDFIALIDKIETNLHEMGVNDAEFDSATGIMGLLDRILDIEGGGESLVINTSISADISPRKDFTIGETTTLSGQLTANSALDNIGNIVLAGATIKVYHYLERSGSSPNDYLIGSGTTDNTGSFSFPLTFQKSGALNLMAEFEGTTHFNSSQVYNTSYSYSVNKKSITLPTVEDKWMLEPTSVDFYIGEQYENVPISLMVGSTKYGPANVDNKGNVTFDLSNSNLHTATTSKLMVESNNVYSSAESNTFNMSIGVNIYINPELQLTSDKDILSYADNESATLTAKIKSDATEISSVNIPLTYKENPVLTATKSGITITEQNNLYLCESINTDGYIIFDMDAEQTETSFTISNVTASSVDSNAKCALVQYYQNGTVTYNWELLDTNNFGNGDYIIRIKDGNIDVYKDGIHVENQNLEEGYKLGFGIYEYSFDISDINIERIINNGLNTGIYTSRGVGDVAITAKYGSLVSEIYSIEDCIDYQPLTSNAHESRWTIPSGVTSVYDNTGWKLSANAYKQVKLTDKLTNDCSVEFTVVDYSNTRDMAIIVYDYTNGETTPNQKILIGGSSIASEWYALGTIDHNLIKGGKYRIEYTSSTLKVYENDVLLGSATNNVGFPTRFEFHTGTNRWAIYKDLKVKPL